MKRPLLTAIASSAAAVAAAVLVLFTAGGISSATALSVESAAPAPASQSDRAADPPPVAVIEPPSVTDNPTVMDAHDAGAPGAAPPPPPPPLAADPPSDEKTARPERSEWKNAPEVGLARASDSRCTARRIREWITVKCAIPGVTGFSLIAGTREGLDFRMNTAEGADTSITFEFPVRRGDRRVFQVNALAGKYGSSPEVILSERWSEGDAGPLLTVAPAI